MSKQVKIPRFYVDIPTFLHATGQLGWDSDNGGAELLYMNCANPYLGTSFQIGVDSNIGCMLYKTLSENRCGILGTTKRHTISNSILNLNLLNPNIRIFPKKIIKFMQLKKSDIL